MLASIWKVKESAMFHSKVCGKSEIIGILLCQSVTFQAPFFSQTPTFVPLTLIIPLSRCVKYLFMPALMIIMVFFLSCRLVIGPNYCMNLRLHIILAMQGETCNGKIYLGLVSITWLHGSR